MATVRKRRWKTESGEEREAWLLHYVDADRHQHRRQYARKSDAEDERIRVEGQIALGVHVPDRKSLTVLGAARAFLADYQRLIAAGKRERSTIRMYRQHVELHLAGFSVANVLLSRLNGGHCKKFARDLEAERSEEMASRVFRTFRMIVDFAVGETWLAANPAKSIRIATKGSRPDVPEDADSDDIDIPPPEQIQKLWHAARDYDATGRAGALVAAMLFGGLSISETRGLPLANLPVPSSPKPVIKVRQRADRWNIIGRVKTKNRWRDVPVGPHALAAFAKWKLAAPKGEHGLAFPNSQGAAWSYPNLYRRLWCKLMETAGLASVEWIMNGDRRTKKIRPFFAPHALRHAAISLWIASGATQKQVMEWAGHGSITTTFNIYGHLWPDGEAEHRVITAVEFKITG